MLKVFILAYLCTLLVLLVPGYTLYRATGLPRTWAVCLAPLASIGCICFFGQLYAFVGIPSSALTLSLPIILVALGLYLISHRFEHTHTIPTLSPFFVVAAMGVGLFLGYWFFLSRLPDFERVYQSYDITEHVNLARAIANSGRFSSLGTNFYLTAADQAINPQLTAGFYPSGWHSLCALVSNLSGAQITMAINATLYAFISCVYPLGCLALCCLLSQGDEQLMGSSILTSLAFVAFPWGLIVFGPLYPNMISLGLVPAALIHLVYLLSPDVKLWERLVGVAAFLLGMGGMALVHPNAVFTLGVIFVPYGAMRCYQMAHDHFGKRIVAYGCAGAFLLAVAAVWYACFKMPFMQPVVLHEWPTFNKGWQEIINILSLSYCFGFSGGAFEYAAQIFLGAAVIIGIVRVLHDDKVRWTAFSYFFACFLCFAGATFYGERKYLFAGFWYSDAFRLGAMASIAAVPLATYGLEWVFRRALELVTRYNDKNAHVTNLRKVTVICGCLFLFLNYMPDFDLPGMYYRFVLNADQYKTMSESSYAKLTGYQRVVWSRPKRSIHTSYGDYRQKIESVYAWPSALQNVELDFLMQIRDQIPKDALVINNPMDGSFLCYGFENIRVYYRYFVGFDGPVENEDSKIIRLKLNEFATNKEVQDAVRRIGAEYVLLLTETRSATSFIDLRGSYHPEQFVGVKAITPETPGFELIASYPDSKMGLYRIVWPED